MDTQSVPSTPPADPDIPFVLSDPRQKVIFERLSRLVSTSSAEFYRDACQLMSGTINPPLAATSNLVGNLLREIESSLRDVLQPLVPSKSMTRWRKLKMHGERMRSCMATALNRKQEQKKSGAHQQERKAILVMLGLGEDSELARAWGGLRLHKLTHRRGLRAIRSADEGVRETWENFEFLLHAILDSFEARYALVFEKLEALAAKENPTKEDAAYFAASVPNNHIAHEHFFSRLSNPKWLPLLQAEKVFKESPALEYGYEDGSKTIRFPQWPAAAYLLKQAPTNPALVKKILSDLEEKGNASVRGSLLEIVAALPAPERSALMDRSKVWMQAANGWYIADSARKLIAKMISDGMTIEAAKLLEALLELHSIPKEPYSLGDGREYTPAPDARSNLDDWHYGNALKQELPQLLEADPSAALGLSIRLLASFLKIENTPRDESDKPFEDHTYISRRAIEDHPQNHNHDEIEDLLIVAVRDAARDIASNNPEQIREIVAAFEKERWTTFKRLAMYLLAENPQQEPGLVSKYLLDRDTFEDGGSHHEYSRLLGRAFSVLSPDEQAVFFGWIEDGKEIVNREEPDGTPISQEQIDRAQDYWRLSKLDLLKDHLSGVWKERYDKLVEKYGIPEHPDFGIYTSDAIGTRGPVSAQDLVAMQPAEVVRFLQTWEPTENARSHFGPTRDSVAQVLSTALNQKPEWIGELADDFKELDPTYVRAFIQAADELSKAGTLLNWVPILDLSKWAVDQPRDLPGREGGVWDQDPDWSWCRKAIASMLIHALNRNSIPFELRARIWGIIEPLTRDPNPQPHEEVRDGEPIDDPYLLAINTVRGEGMTAIVEYGLWVRRNLAPEDQELSPELGTFENMPEVRVAFEEHLEPARDRSAAVRAIYGRFLPWISLMDKAWVKDNLTRIFSKIEIGGVKMNAAWDAYMLYVPIYDEVFDMLKAQYQAAIRELVVDRPQTSSYKNPRNKLAEQLMIMYWRGKIGLTDELMESFWDSADESLRAHALDFVGHQLASNDAIDEETLGRMKALWDSRVQAAENPQGGASHSGEMNAFVWWFSSDKFDPEWSADRYLASLEFGAKNHTSYAVVESLKSQASAMPLTTVRILAKLTQLTQPNWVLIGNRAQIGEILDEALSASDETAKAEAKELISRLISRGYAEYADLLKKHDSHLERLES